MISRVILTLLLLLAAAHAEAVKIVVIGDSNTEWGSYPAKILRGLQEAHQTREYTLVNAGLAGAAISAFYYTHMPAAVDAERADIAVLLFGINDLNWGMDPTPSMESLYFEYTAKAAVKLLEQGVKKVIVLNYPPTQKAMAWTPETKRLCSKLGEIAVSDDSYLQTVSDAMFAKLRNIEVSGRRPILVDVQRPMRKLLQSFEAQENGKLRLMSPDGVHLNELGNEVIARLILKAMGEKADLSNLPLTPASQDWPNPIDGMPGYRRVHRTPVLKATPDSPPPRE